MAPSPEHKPKTKRFRIRLTIIAIFTLAALILWEAERTSQTSSTLNWQNAVYVWQSVWHPPVLQAIRLAAEEECPLFFLVAEYQYENSTLKIRRSYPDWKTLKELTVPITPVIRLETNVMALLETKTGTVFENLANSVCDTVEQTLQKTTSISGVQFDFDCPTAKLKQYAELLTHVHHRFPALTVSATVLPTWLKNRGVRYLYAHLDYFVLQTHALKPATERDTWTLFDPTRFDNYVHRASSAGIPYYIALPTYGYGVITNEQGELAGITAESPSDTIPEGFTLTEVRADPTELAAIVRRLQTRPPENCLGIAWFRLPVETDDRNWSWEVLRSVMKEGRTFKEQE